MKTEHLYGIHPVLEALRAGRRRFFEIHIARGKPSKRIEEIRKRGETLGAPLRSASPAQLNAKAGAARHQGVVARVSAYPWSEPEDIVGNLRSPLSQRFILLLDSIVDPHNLGALVRTALGVGADGVIIPKRRAAPPTPVVSRISSGALEHIRLGQAANMAETLKAIKKQGIWVVGMDAGADRSLYDCDLTGPIALVIGGEEKGIRPLVRKQCDVVMAIPQKDRIDSLNASVAGAVAMYEALRQRMLENR